MTPAGTAGNGGIPGDAQTARLHADIECGIEFPEFGGIDRIESEFPGKIQFFLLNIRNCYAAAAPDLQPLPRQQTDRSAGTIQASGT